MPKAPERLGKAQTRDEVPPKDPRRLAMLRAREQDYVAMLEESERNVRQTYAAGLAANIEWARRTYEPWEAKEQIALCRTKNAKELKQALDDNISQDDFDNLTEIRREIAELE